MRHFTRLILPALVAITLLTVANTAQAGEPQESNFWLRPVIDFFIGWL